MKVRSKEKPCSKNTNNKDNSANMDKQLTKIDCIQKKKRGRPRKLIKAVVNTLTEQINNDNDNDITGGNKKRRSSRIKSDKISEKLNSNAVGEKDKKGAPNLEIITHDLEQISIKKELDERNDDVSSASDDGKSNINYKRKRKKIAFNVNIKRRPGRPKGVKGKNICDNDYVPHHSHIDQSSKKEKSKPNLLPNTTQSDSKVSCGKCNMEILKSKWSQHNLSNHNDLGWINGTVKPDFQNDEKLVKRVLFNAIKKRKGNLICESCNLVKRSVLGYLSHIRFCGKDEDEKQALMITCHICQSVIKPSSLEYHERMHKAQTEEKKNNGIEKENIDLGPRTKRKAAEKAVSKISEFTALGHEDKDDKDNALLIEKKSKQNSKLINKFIQKPQLEKKIPSTVLRKWQEELDNGNSASCNQIGCQFNSNSLTDIKKHYSMCNFTPEKEYACKICRLISSSEDEIVKHVLENHPTEKSYDPSKSVSDEESYSSGNVSEIDDVSDKNHVEQKKLSSNENNKFSNQMFKFLSRNGANCNKYNKPFFAAFQWTLEFEQKNYKFNLFEEFTPNNFVLLSLKESMKYLSETEESMFLINENTNQESSESKWKRWKRFEGHYIQDNPTFFVGGPVWALAWLPIPTILSFSENISQFVAISTHPTMDREYTIQGSFPGKNIIQIWDFGELNNKMNSICNPKLAYAIAHEGGTVWCLEWCPSGCYQSEKVSDFFNKNNELKRMGLLAAACSDGCIQIYSLVFPEDLPSSKDYSKIRENQNIKHTENLYPIYHTEPVFTLIVNLNMYDQKQQTWQTTKLSWTKENEHNIIAGGFSNGYIALWNLTSKSPLLKFKRGSTVFLQPYRHFFAHHHAVTMVHLIPQDNKRFLASASLDRNYKFWDLEDISNPRYCLKKSFVTDGSWLTNWCCALLAYDDALSMNHNYSYCVPLREYTYKCYNILPTNSTCYTIATSDFGNSIAHGTLAGEILAVFPQQLLYIRDMEKSIPRKRFIVSSMEVTDFEDKSENKEPVANKNQKKKNNKAEYKYMPSTYSESKDRFGLKFVDNMNLSKEEQPKNSKRKVLTCEMLQKVPVEQYPFKSVNRLSWNPNAWSFLWLAAGYQNGFVRLIPLKSMSSVDEWNKLLHSHIDAMKCEGPVT